MSLRTLKPTDYADIFVAAIEGGINYWARVQQYEFDFAETGHSPAKDYARAYVIDEETFEAHELDSRDEKWHTAVEKAADYFGVDLETFLEDHDAGYADVAVQFAIFGEVIYG